MARRSTRINERTSGCPWILSEEEGLKHVAINDEMHGGTNLTVVAMLREFYLKLLPQRTSFENDVFVPQPFPRE